MPSTVSDNQVSHTPGPWIVEGTLVYASEPCGYRKGVEQCRNRFDANVQGPHTPYEERKANARLIAAAPELLAALKELRNEITGILGIAVSLREDIGNTNISVLLTKIGAAEAVIAKAEGR